MTNETLRKWVRQAEIDGGARPGVTSAEAERVKELERENRELRWSVKNASTTFARATARASSRRAHATAVTSAAMTSRSPAGSSSRSRVQSDAFARGMRCSSAARGQAPA